MQIGCCVNNPTDFGMICAQLEKRHDACCAQVFVRQPTAWKDVHSAEQLAELKEWAANPAHKLYVHGAYVSTPWSGSKGSLYNISLEMSLCAYIGASGYIIHLAPGCRQRALLVAVLSRMKNTCIFFEVNAVKASATSFFTVDALGEVFDLITEVADTYNVTVGLCIDTAHMFAGGVSFEHYEPTKEFLARIANRVRVPIIFHVNDSYEQLGSGRDKHAELCKGNIWNNVDIADSGLKAIVEFAKVHKSALILEQDFGSALRGIKILTKMK